MREVQSDTNYDAVTRGTEASILLGTAAFAGDTGVSIEYLQSDWSYAVSIDFRPRNALAD